MSEKAELEGLMLGWRSSSPIYRTTAILPLLTERNENKFYKLMKIETPADFRKAVLSGN